MITQDEIIKMASMAGFETKNGMVWVDQWEVTRSMERIVRAAYAAGAAAEREACLKLVEPTEEHRRDASWGFLGGAEGVELLDEIATAIRTRSAK